MIVFDKERAKRAVQYLVESSYTHHHVRKLRTAVEKPRSLPFKDDAEELNELLVVGRQNLQAMENLIAVAEYKRGGKNEYQKLYMAAKRKRDKKVLHLEELMSGAAPPKTFHKRILDAQYRIWNAERERMLSLKPSASWTQRNELTKKFWDAKERELDELIEEAKASGPVKRRKRVVALEQTPKTHFGKTLANAIKK